MELRSRSDLEPGELVVVDRPDGEQVVVVSNRLSPEQQRELLALHGLRMDDEDVVSRSA